MPPWVSLALVPVFPGAIVTIHGPAGFLFTIPNGGSEYLAARIVALLVIVLSADGAHVGKAILSPIWAEPSY